MSIPASLSLDWPLLALIAAVTGGASWWGCGRLVGLLTRRGIMDRPNARSSHDEAKPRGAGLAIVGAVALAWNLAPAVGYDFTPTSRVVLIAMAGLAVLSWLDDLRGLNAGVRLLVQAICVVAVLWSMGDRALLFQGAVPVAVDKAIAFLAWIWFINLFNFMDGIDGIAAVETLAIAGGLVLVTILAGGPREVIVPAVLIAAATLGFLPWNLEPSRIFLGDVGSVPLGFLLGWLLLETATAGAWAVALLLPLYYLLDATGTLLRRLARRERIWRAHREHWYQRAVAGGRTHRAVVERIALANVLLIGAGLVAAAGHPWIALGIGAAVGVGLIVVLSRSANARRPL